MRALKLFAAQVAFVASFVLFAAVCFAQEVVPPSGDEWGALIAALGNLKGAGVLGISALVVQVLMLGVRQFNFAGKYRLLVMCALSVGGASIGLKISSPAMSWLQILSSGAVLAALQLLAHQVKKQFFDKKV